MFVNAQPVRQIYDIRQIGPEPNNIYIQIYPDYFGVKLIYAASGTDQNSLKKSNESIQKHIDSVSEAMLKESKNAILRMSYEGIGEVDYVGPEIFLFLPKLGYNHEIKVFCLVPLDSKKSELDNLRTFLRLNELLMGLPRPSPPPPDQLSESGYEFTLSTESRYPVLAIRSNENPRDKLKQKIDAMMESEAVRLPSFYVYKTNLSTYNQQPTKASLLSLYFSTERPEITLEKK